MNEFIITEVQHRVHAEHSFDYMAQLGHNSSMSINYNQVPTVELTLRPKHPCEQTMKKLANIVEAGRTVVLNDTEYNNFIEPFKREFIEFMMEKYPERLMADTKAWEILRG